MPQWHATVARRPLNFHCKVRGKTVPGGQNCPVFDKVSAGADLEGASGSWTGKVTKAFQATPSVRYFQ